MTILKQPQADENGKQIGQITICRPNNTDKPSEAEKRYCESLSQQQHQIASNNNNNNKRERNIT